MGANTSADDSSERAAPHATPRALTQRAATPSESIGLLPEILELLAHCLVGFDVLQLSHTCRAFRSELSSPSVWSHRIVGLTKLSSIAEPPSTWCTDQAIYFRARSLRFRGLPSLPQQGPLPPRHTVIDKILKRKPKPEHERVDVCEMTFTLLPIESGLLSFDLWFSLLDSAESVSGGVLLGVQSHSCFIPNKIPHHSDRLVQIDPERNLYCSVLVGKPVVASALEVNRWYHLALAFDGTVQRVYLDGELVSSGRGVARPQDKWHWMRHAQLGSGYIAESSRGKPSPSFGGWYPFHGLVDEFRVWYDVLSDEQIQQLARTSIEPTATPRPVFELSRDRGQHRNGVQRVRSSRPVERHAIIY